LLDKAVAWLEWNKSPELAAALRNKFDALLALAKQCDEELEGEQQEFERAVAELKAEHGRREDPTESIEQQIRYAEDYHFVIRRDEIRDGLHLGAFRIVEYVRSLSTWAMEGLGEEKGGKTPEASTKEHGKQTANEPSQKVELHSGAASQESQQPVTCPSPPAGAEFSAPMSLSEMARRITGDPDARPRKVRPLLKRYGLEQVGNSGRLWRVRLETMDAGTRRKIEMPEKR